MSRHTVEVSEKQSPMERIAAFIVDKRNLDGKESWPFPSRLFCYNQTLQKGRGIDCIFFIHTRNLFNENLT